MEIGVGIIFLINLPMIITKWESFMRTKKNIIYAVMLLVMAIFSTMLMKDSDINYFLELIVYFFAFVIGRCYMKNYPQKTINGIKNIKNIMVLFCIYGILEALTCRNYLAEFLGFENMSIYRNEVTTFLTYRVKTLFVHSIVYGNILLIALGILFFYERNVKTFKWQFFLITINIFFTKSRSVWLVFLIEIFIMFYFYRKENKDTKKYVYLIMFLLTVLFVVLLLMQLGINILPITMITNRFEALNGSDSYTQRAGVVPVLINEFKNANILHKIIGFGAHSSKIFMLSHRISIANFGTVDNEWLSVFFDFGLVGVISMCLIFLTNLKRLFLNANNKYKMITMAIVTTLLMFLFYDGLTWFVVYYLLFLLIGSESYLGEKDG